MADDMLPTVYDSLALGPRTMLLKGRYLAGMSAAGEDGMLQGVFVIADGAERIYAYTYIDTPRTHGVSYTLSAIIAAHPARGDALEAAIEISLDYLLHVIGTDRHLAPGQSAGPSNRRLASRSLAASRSSEVDINED